MSTSSVIVEHLLAGVIGLTGIVFLALSMVGVEWINPDFIKDWSVPLGTLTLALAYPFGLAADEASDRIAGWLGQRRATENTERDEVTTVFKMLAETNSEFLCTYFSYTRSRLRMLRSATFTLPLLTTGVVAFITTRIPGVFWTLPAVITVAGLCASIFCGWAGRSVTNQFAVRRAELSCLMESRKRQREHSL